MNRIVKLEELCSRIGIFKRTVGGGGGGGDKLSTTLEWGPYGHLLLNQIKSVWLARNLHKQPNTYLIDVAATSNSSSATAPLSLFSSSSSFFNTSLGQSNIWLDDAHQSVGLVSMTSGSEPNEPGRKSPHMLLAGVRSVTNMCVQRIDMRAGSGNGKQSVTAVDAGVEWQNERLNWWTKFLNSPENMSVEKFEPSDDALEPHSLVSSLVYRLHDGSSLTCETIKFTANSKSPFSATKNEKPITSMITSRTSPELILECVLFDSIDIPSEEDNAELAKYDLKRRLTPKLSLDMSLAPFKLAILYKRDDHAAKSMACDLKHMLYLSNVHGVLLYAVDDDQTALSSRYASLDLLGVPYALYLPSCVTKDGLCAVRNRETTLCERVHITNVVKQFRAILDSLNY